MNAQRRGKARIIGRIWFRDALGVKRALPQGECEVAFNGLAPTLYVINSGRYVLSYNLGRHYILSCIERGALVFDDPAVLQAIALRL